MVAPEAGMVCSDIGPLTASNVRAKNTALIPGKVSEYLFDVLIELSAIHSKKIVKEGANKRGNSSRLRQIAPLHAADYPAD